MLRGDRLPGERWGETDSLLLQALTLYESMTCPGCGHPIWESMDAENTGRYIGEKFRCHACDAIAQVGDQVANTKGYQRPSALRFTAHLPPTASTPPTPS